VLVRNPNNGVAVSVHALDHLHAAHTKNEINVLGDHVQSHNSSHLSHNDIWKKHMIAILRLMYAHENSDSGAIPTNSAHSDTQTRLASRIALHLCPEE